MPLYMCACVHESLVVANRKTVMSGSACLLLLLHNTALMSQIVLAVYILSDS